MLRKGKQPETALESLLPFPQGWMLPALVEGTPWRPVTTSEPCVGPSMAAPLHPTPAPQPVSPSRPPPPTQGLAPGRTAEATGLTRGQTQELGFPRTARDTSTSCIPTLNIYSLHCYSLQKHFKFIKG